MLKTIKHYLIKFLKKELLNTCYFHGDPERVKIGKNVSIVNTILNTGSGDIEIGDNTIFGHNVMLLTGRHEFTKGIRKKILTGESDTPKTGYNIRIGSGCWIASGAIVIGGVTIGKNVIVSSGSVVMKNIPDGVMVAGVPAKVVRKL